MAFDSPDSMSFSVHLPWVVWSRLQRHKDLVLVGLVDLEGRVQHPDATHWPSAVRCYGMPRMIYGVVSW